VGRQRLSVRRRRNAWRKATLFLSKSRGREFVGPREFGNARSSVDARGVEKFLTEDRREGQLR